jgi:hypothetical protein
MLHFSFGSSVPIFILATILRRKRRKDPFLFPLTEVGGFTESLVLTVGQFLNVGVLQKQNQSADTNEESDLDLEYAMTLTDPTPVTLLQAGDLFQGLYLGSRVDYVPLISALNL